MQPVIKRKKKNPDGSFMKNPDGSFVYEEAGTAQIIKQNVRKGGSAKLTLPGRRTEHIKAAVTTKVFEPIPAHTAKPAQASPQLAQMHLQNEIMKKTKEREKNKKKMLERYGDSGIDPFSKDETLAKKLQKNDKFKKKNEEKVVKKLRKDAKQEIGLGADARLGNAIESIEKKAKKEEKKEKQQDKLKEAESAGHINQRKKRPLPTQPPSKTEKRLMDDPNEYKRMIDMIQKAPWHNKSPEEVIKEKGYKATDEKTKKGKHATVDFYTSGGRKISNTEKSLNKKGYTYYEAGKMTKNGRLHYYTKAETGNKQYTFLHPKDETRQPKRVQNYTNEQPEKKHKKEVGLTIRARHPVKQTKDGRYYYRNPKSNRRVYVKNFLPHE
jgi:hypothetical protein